MGRFGEDKYSGDGSKLPLGKKISKWFFNLKAGLGRDKRAEEDSVHHVGRALK